jgi:hypothetical protein
MDSALLLGHSASWWDSTMLISLAVAALVAFIVAGATAGSVVANKREAAAAKEELDRYKSDADTKIAEANEGAAQANERAEQIKQLVKWRTIDPVNMKILVSELAKGGGEIDLAFVPSDPESEYFALKMIGNGGFAAVNDAGHGKKWRVFMRPYISNGMFFGLAIPGPENDQVKFLRHAFSEAHIPFSTEDPPAEVPPITLGSGLAYTPPPKHSALIVVGLKHPPV